MISLCAGSMTNAARVGAAVAGEASSLTGRTVVAAR